MEVSTDYSITLSYPGVFPVQYTVYLEKDEEEDSSSYDTKRRIQDTRLFSFHTNENGDIVKIDENGEIVYILWFSMNDRFIIYQFCIFNHIMLLTRWMPSIIDMSQS